MNMKYKVISYYGPLAILKSITTIESWLLITFEVSQAF